MTPGTETGRTDPSEARFNVQEWLQAVLAMAVVLAGASATLGVTYWFFTHR
jgi:hypothetical protein